MIRSMLLVALLVVLTAGAWAQRGGPRGNNGAPQDPNAKLGQEMSFIGTSDIIVTATVKEAKLPELPTAGAGARFFGFGRGGMRQGNNAAVTFTVDKVLKGTLAGATLTQAIPLNLDFTVQTAADGQRTFTPKGWLPNLPAGQKCLLYLRRGQDGLSVQNTFTGLQAVTDVVTVEELVKTFPGQVAAPTFAAPAGFGVKTACPVTVKNTSETPFVITDVRVEGYYLSKKIASVAQINVQATEPALRDAAGKDKPLIVNAGDEATLTATMVANEPDGWQLFDHEAYLQTPLRVRVVVTAQMPGEADKMVTWQIASRWSTILMGHALPTIEE